MSPKPAMTLPMASDSPSIEAIALEAADLTLESAEVPADPIVLKEPPVAVAVASRALVEVVVVVSDP